MIEGVADALEMMCRHVHVHFRRLDGTVTEHGLDGAQVGVVFEQVGREAMPERVRRDMLLDSGFSRDGGTILWIPLGSSGPSFEVPGKSQVFGLTRHER